MKYALGLRKLPFPQDSHDILYVENRYDEEVNDYIQRNYDRIQRCFSRKGYRLVYMPRIIADVCQTDVLRYNAPYAQNTQIPALSSDWLLDYMVHPENRENFTASLLFYHPRCISKNYTEAECQYIGIELHDCDYAQTDDLSTVLDEIVDYIYPKCAKRREKDREEVLRSAFIPDDIEAHVRFRKREKERENDGIRFYIPITADETFNVESKQLIEEVRERIEKLRLYGIDESILEALFHKEEKLSRLVVTKDYDIVLPDYNNMKIEMRPLPKAVYLLFLRHPEGIAFKYLSEYRQELIDIYAKLRGRILSKFNSKSIDDVVDPLNNSINEKCARIREAFVTKFSDHIARNYYVDGRRGEAKKILLARDLVVWE